MKTKLIIIGAILAVVLFTYVGMYISYTNQEVELREGITAKIKDNESNYTKMWEILTQKAGVTQQYSKDFKEIYPELIKGRYSNGGGDLMMWIKEHNPDFDTSLYKDLMMSIEAQRESFHTTQEQLLDMSRQHNVLLSKIPSKWFLSGVGPIDIPIVINDAAEEAFATGKETKMELFK